MSIETKNIINLNNTPFASVELVKQNLKQNLIQKLVNRQVGSVLGLLISSKLQALDSVKTSTLDCFSSIPLKEPSECPRCSEDLEQATQDLYRYKMDDKSVEEFCPHKEAMVYGFTHCEYIGVNTSLENKDVKTYHDGLGDYKHPEGAKRPNGRKIYQINTDLKDADLEDDIKEINRQCKAALVNLVLENYASQNDNVPQIPIIFCTDITSNPFPLSSEEVLSKELVTHHELRQAYKLCYDPHVDPSIQEIAKKSFKFVKVDKTTAGSHDEIINIDHHDGTPPHDQKRRINDIDMKLSRAQAPWEAPDWDTRWQTRKNQKKPALQSKQYDWRKETNHFVIQSSHKKT